MLGHASLLLLVLSGFVGGMMVGIAGMGGGALMTPALVLLFGVDPRVAIASDLVNSLAMKPVGGAVHALGRSVNWPLVRLLVVPGAPAAFFGAWLLNQLGDGSETQGDLRVLLGVALVVACASMVARGALDAGLIRSRERHNFAPWRLKPVATVLAGLVGGLMVGMTSVGSGSLVIVLLMLLYPRLSAHVQVGTNLVQAIPLVAAASLGQLLFGHISFGVSTGLMIGSVPGVFLGARVSRRAPEAMVRPVLLALLTASGLALLITDYTGLAVALVATGVVGGALWAAVDATLHRSGDWSAAGYQRTAWVASMAVLAPLGVGALAGLVYVLKVRPRVVAAAARAKTAERRAVAPVTA